MAGETWGEDDVEGLLSTPQNAPPTEFEAAPFDEAGVAELLGEGLKEDGPKSLTSSVPVVPGTSGNEDDDFEQELTHAFQEAFVPSVGESFDRVLSLSRNLNIPASIIEADVPGFEASWAAQNFDAKAWRKGPEGRHLERLVKDHRAARKVIIQDEPKLRTFLRGISNFVGAVTGAEEGDFSKLPGQVKRDKPVSEMGFMEKLQALAAPKPEVTPEESKQAQELVAPTPEKVPTVEAPEANLTGVDRLKIYTAHFKHSRKQAELGALGTEALLRAASGQGRDYELEKRIQSLQQELAPTPDYKAGPIESFALQGVETFASSLDSLAGGGAAAAGAAGVAGGITYGVTRSPALAKKAAAGAAKIAGPIGAGLASAVQETGHAFLTYRDATTDDGSKVDVEIAAGTAALVGLASSSLDVVGLNAMLKVHKGLAQALVGKAGAQVLKEVMANRTLRNITRRVGKELLHGAKGEGLTEGLQEVLIYLGGYGAKSIAAGELQRFDTTEFATQVVESGVAGAVGSLAMGVPGAVASTAAQTLRKHQAERAGKKTAAIAGLAKDSPTVRAIPGGVAKMIEAATAADGEPVTHVYIDPDAVVRFFQSANGDMDAAAVELMGAEGPARIREAIATGDKLEVPLEDYLTKWGPKEVAEALVEDTTTRPGHLTPRQLVAQEEEISAKTAELVKAEEAKAKDAPELQPEAESLLVQLEQDLANAGMKPKDAKVLGTLWRARLRTMLADNPNLNVAEVLELRVNGGEDASFEFGERPVESKSGLEEARGLVARMRDPEKKALAEAWLAFTQGETTERPAVTPDLEKQLARYGVVDPEGFDYAADGRDLSAGTKTRTKGKAGPMPAELRAAMLRRNLSATEYSALSYSDLYRQAQRAEPAPTSDEVFERLHQDFAAMAPEERNRRYFTDAVTGSLNERAFEAGGTKYQPHIAIRVGAIKAVNDTFSHAQADQFIQDVARVAGPKAHRVRGDLVVSGDANWAETLRGAMRGFPSLQGMPIEVTTGATAEEAVTNLSRQVDLRKLSKDPAVRWPARKELPGALRKGEPTPFEGGQVKAELTAKHVLEDKPEAVRAAAETIYREKGTGVLTKAGFDRLQEIDPKKHVVMIDMNGLRVFHEVLEGIHNFSPEKARKFGDFIIQEFTTAAVQEGGAKFDLAHFGGDEYALRGDDKDALRDFSESLRTHLAEAWPALHDVETGGIYALQGIGFGYGIGSDRREADEALNADKERLSREGKRGDFVDALRLRRFSGWVEATAARDLAWQELHPVQGPRLPEVALETPTGVAVHRYVSPRQRELTPEEASVRGVAYALLEGKPEAIAQAAPEMAAKVPPGAVLVPVPSSKGTTEANRALADAIAKLAGAEVADVLTGEARESQRGRRLRGLPGLPAEALKVTAAQLPAELAGRPVVLIDNVRTTGATITAAQRALPGARYLTYAQAPEVTTLEQSAFHGTPHRGIKKFSLQKIGTGEGAQVYGWGLYFASKREVAEYYRKGLTAKLGQRARAEWNLLPPGEDDPKAFYESLTEQERRDWFDMNGGLHWYAKRPDPAAPVLEMIRDTIPAQEQWLAKFADTATDAEKQKARDLIALKKRQLELVAKHGLVAKPPFEPGQVYKVEVPDDDVLLDYDKPLAEQTHGVVDKLIASGILKGIDREAMALAASEFAEVDAAIAELQDKHGVISNPEIDLLYEEAKKWKERTDPLVTLPNGEHVRLSKLDGRIVYEALAESFSTTRETDIDAESPQEWASKRLLQSGIPGLRYLDGGSRLANDEGTHNYVVWDEKQIEIRDTYYQGKRLYRGVPAEASEPSENARFGKAYYYADNGEAAREFAKNRGPGAKVEERDLDDRRVLFDSDKPDQADPRFEKLVALAAKALDLDEAAARSIAAGGVMELADEFNRRAKPAQQAAFAERQALERADGRVVTPTDPRLSEAARAALSRGMWPGQPEAAQLVREAGYDGITIHSNHPDAPAHQEYAFFEPLPERLYQAQKAPQKNLLVQHNLTAENLLHAEELGGLAAPSLAIGRVEHPMENFGEITLLGGPELADPKRGEQVYASDVYSPRWPDTKHKLDGKKLRKLEQELAPFAKAIGSYLGDLDQEIERRGPEGAAGERRIREALALAYLAEKGEKLEAPLRPARLRHEISAMPALVEFFKANGIKRDFDPSDDYGKALASAARKAIDEHIAQDPNLEPGDAAEIGKAYFDEDTGELAYRYADHLARDASLVGTQEKDTHALVDQVRARIEALGEAEFEQWATDKLAAVVTDRRMVKGSRTIPYTLENIVKHLTANIRAGEGFNYGLGSARAKGTRRFTSLEQIKKARDKIISDGDFEKVKQAMDDRMVALSERAGGTLEGFVDAVGESYRRGGSLRAGLRANGLQVDEALAQEIATFASDLLAMPTEYFEVKPRRAMAVSEFKAAVVPEDVSPKALEVLKKHGLKIHTYSKEDRSSRQKAIEKASRDEDIVFQKDEDEDEPRGFTTMVSEGATRIYNVVLNQNADFSTFLHESAHVFLDLQEQLVKHPKASQREKESYATILKWLGTTPEAWAGMSLEQRRPLHEKFARAFEAYLYEGKAPSNALRRAFHRFRTWLREVYRSIRSLDVELSDDIRGSFDRLLATDQEIARTQKAMGLAPMFRSPEEAGMSAEEWQAYLEAQEDATSSAEMRLGHAALKDKLRETEKWWKDELAEQAAAAEREYDAKPEARAAHFLRTGELRGEDNQVLTTGERPWLDREAVAYAWGKALPEGLPLRVRKGGENPDNIAEMFGFADTRGMIDALRFLPDRTLWVAEQAEDRVRAAHPELLDDLTKLRAEAAKSLHGEHSSRWLLKEWRALAARARFDPETGQFFTGGQKMKGGGTVPITRVGLPPVEAIMRAAAQLVDRKNIGALHAGRALQAERSAADKAARAAAKGQLEQALVYKQQQLLNHYLYKHLTEALELREAFEELAGNLTDDKQRGKLGKASPAYRDAVDLVLETLGLAPERRREEPLRSLGELVAELEANGETVAFDPQALGKVLAKGMLWKQLSVAEIRLVHGALLNVKKAASNRNTALVDGKRVEKEGVVAALVAEASQHLPDQGPVASSEGAMAMVEQLRSGAASMDGELLRPETMLRWLGGVDKLESMWFRALVKPFQDAKVREADILEMVVKPIVAAFSSIPKETRRRLMEKVDGEALFPGHRADMRPPSRRFELLLMALNRGNQGNIDRLTAGRAITLDQVDKALELLTKEEWQWVQEVLDAMEALRPLMAEVEERDSGLQPEWVEATPMPTRFGTYRGGYFPAVYDRRVTAIGEKQALNTIAALMDPSYTRPGTARGHLKERAKDFADAIVLDPTVIQAHLAQAAHDIAFREAVKSVGGLVLTPEVQASLRAHLGERSSVFLQWVKDVGQARATVVSHARWWNKLLGALKSNFATSILGYAADVAAGDFSNFAVSLAATPLKSKHLGAGLFEFTKAPVDTRKWVLEKSGELRFRAGEHARDLQNALANLTKRGGRARDYYDAFKGHAFTLFEYVEAAVVTPIWLGAYRQSLAEGKGDAEAVTFADALARKLVPAKSVVDKSAALRDRGFVGAVTLFHGYANTAFQLYRDLVHPIYVEGHAGGAGAGARALARQTPKILGTAIGIAILGEILSGRRPDEDEGWREFFLRKLLLAPLYAQPLPLSAPAESLWMGKEPSVRAAPQFAFLDAILRALKDSGSDKELGDKLLAIVKALGPTTGAPQARPARVVQAIVDLLSGELEPADFPGAAVYGERFPDKRSVLDIPADMVGAGQ